MTLHRNPCELQPSHWITSKYAEQYISQPDAETVLSMIAYPLKATDEMPG
jgi:hypothetical protein